MRGRTKEHFMSGVRYSARLLVRKRSLCIGGQGHVQVVFFSAAAAAVSHNPLKPGTKSSRANKVSVHTHSSHSRYRPTTLLLLLLECFSVLESLLVYLATCWKANTFRFFYLPKSISNSVKRFRPILYTEFSVRVEQAQPRNSLNF